MTAYIAKRILLMLPTLFGVLVITFLVTQFVPGGPVEQYLVRKIVSWYSEESKHCI